MSRNVSGSYAVVYTGYVPFWSCGYTVSKHKTTWNPFLTALGQHCSMSHSYKPSRLGTWQRRHKFITEHIYISFVMRLVVRHSISSSWGCQLPELHIAYLLHHEAGSNTQLIYISSSQWECLFFVCLVFLVKGNVWVPIASHSNA